MMVERGETEDNNIDERVAANTHEIEELKQYVTRLNTMVQ